MEWNWNYVTWSILISLISLVWHLRRKNSYRRFKLPPGPRGWPIFGNLFDLGSLPHRTLEKLKDEYGPVVWLNLGPVKTMVILSSVAAEELYKNNDLSFADRFQNDAMRSHDYYKSSMALGAYNSYWRTLRRICTIELFTIKRINDAVLIRRKCADEMISWIEKEAEKGASGGIEVINFVFSAIFNIVGNLTVSRDLVDPQSTMSSEFINSMTGLHEGLLRLNISDLVPSLSRFDIQGVRKEMDVSLGKVNEIISGFVKERKEQRRQRLEISSEQRKDFLDVLLDFSGTSRDEPAKLTDHQLTIFLMEMFLAGTHTSSSTTEWAMCELLLKPDKMKKVKDELARVVGGNRKLEESDMDNLPYLQAIVEETLRLHPPGPLTLPRKAMHDTKFMGYNIPKGTQVFVNAWAIGREKESWEDALSFKPERFLDSRISYKGQNFEFIPFGAGRRICPGLPLAHRMLPLLLGTLLHHFDWKLCGGETKMDMMETMGIGARKQEPLMAVPTRRKNLP
uniref:Cytochrome P450 CYP76AE4 n=1 Tax=Thapsia laciniata TaxID=1306261 RepID=A0A3Q8TIX5_9APIA|nr:cytochrome P450 CYP76AE4 [Thapsia villosa var. laciniata]